MYLDMVKKETKFRNKPKKMWASKKCVYRDLNVSAINAYFLNFDSWIRVPTRIVFFVYSNSFWKFYLKKTLNKIFTPIRNNKWRDFSLEILLFTIPFSGKSEQISRESLFTIGVIIKKKIVSKQCLLIKNKIQQKYYKSCNVIWNAFS